MPKTFPPPPPPPRINTYCTEDKYDLEDLIIIIIQLGGAITDLTAEQTALTTVQVTWTAPPGPPAQGYQITVAEASIDVTGQESPYTFTASELGVHTVQVMYTSQHFPNEQAIPVMVIVEGEGDSIV